MKERSTENDEHYSHDHHHRTVILYLPSALPSAQVTQAAFEDLRDIWRDTFDPGEISALGVILLIHADNCCSSDDTFDLGAILGLERDTFDLGEIPIVAVNPSCEYLGADQLEFLLRRNSARCWNFGRFLDPFFDVCS